MDIQTQGLPRVLAYIVERRETERRQVVGPVPRDGALIGPAQARAECVQLRAILRAREQVDVARRSDRGLFPHEWEQRGAFDGHEGNSRFVRGREKDFELTPPYPVSLGVHRVAVGEVREERAHLGAGRRPGSDGRDTSVKPWTYAVSLHGESGRGPAAIVPPRGRRLERVRRGILKPVDHLLTNLHATPCRECQAGSIGHLREHCRDYTR